MYSSIVTARKHLPSVSALKIIATPSDSSDRRSVPPLIAAKTAAISVRSTLHMYSIFLVRSSMGTADITIPAATGISIAAIISMS